jgi:hypothetical protein
VIPEPSWTLQIGEQQYRGTGLLHKPLWPSSDQFDSFSVVQGGNQLVVLPKEGRILNNLTTALQVAPGKLIWFRRMQIIIGGSVSRACALYGIGIENISRNGFRLFTDGRIERGLN